MPEVRSPAAIARRQERHKVRRQAWRKTPEGMYTTQRYKANQRGIPWQISLDEWLTLWGDRLNQRGAASGDMLVMARYGDVGPYSVANVRIITSSENCRERELLKGNPPMENTQS